MTSCKLQEILKQQYPYYEILEEILSRLSLSPYGYLGHQVQSRQADYKQLMMNVCEVVYVIASELEGNTSTTN